MDLLFVLIAVCPAVILANYDLKGAGFTWKAFLTGFAGWFYGITMVNLIRMYLQGRGSFDFSVLTVSFLSEYMVCSLAVILLVQAARGIWNEGSSGKEAQKGSSHDR